MKKIILLVIIAAISLGKIKAQNEYLVKVDPSTGAFTKLDSIPDVLYIGTAPNYTNLIEPNNSYFFNGIPWYGGQGSLFAINMSDGTVQSKVSINSPVSTFVYGKGSGILYGIRYGSPYESLVSVNINTGSFTTINTLTGIASVDEMTYNNNSNQLFILGENGTGSRFLYTVNGTDGTIVSSIAMVLTKNMQFDNTTNQLYGFQGNDLVKINSASGQVTTIYSIASNQTPEEFNGTIDEGDNYFIFTVEDQNNLNFLYAVNLNTGDVVYVNLVDHTFSNDATSPNVTEYRFNNTNDTLYALHYEPATAMPVTFLSFTASAGKNENILQWVTTNEVNCSYFNVQRSIDDINFKAIGSVNSIIGNASEKDYSFNDKNLVLNSSTIYYRLQNVDKDGSFTYSEIRSINFKTNFSVSFYPNPSTDKINLVIYASQNETAQIEVIDMQGKVVSSSNKNIAAGASIQSINVSALAKGNYFVRIKTTEGETSEKFVKE